MKGRMQMNLDSKNLIRWGIPGWMLLAILISYFTISDYGAVKSFIFSKDVPIIVSSNYTFYWDWDYYRQFNTSNQS